jgi:hypothetical protein
MADGFAVGRFQQSFLNRKAPRIRVNAELWIAQASVNRSRRREAAGSQFSGNLRPEPVALRLPRTAL